MYASHGLDAALIWVFGRMGLVSDLVMPVCGGGGKEIYTAATLIGGINGEPFLCLSVANVRVFTFALALRVAVSFIPCVDTRLLESVIRKQIKGRSTYLIIITSFFYRGCRWWRGR